MGFYLIGIKPKNKKGEYFRNNVWWWRRLWHFVCQITPLSAEAESRGGFNDGFTIAGTEHRKLVKKLKEALDNKDIYAEQIEVDGLSSNHINELVDLELAIKGKDVKKQEQLTFSILDGKNENYPFDWENVKEFYDFCRNNEGFQIC